MSEHPEFGVDWYDEGKATGQLAIDEINVDDKASFLWFVRREYESLLKQVGQRRTVSTYREYLRGYYVGAGKPLPGSMAMKR